MSPTWQAVFYAAAIVCFLLAAYPPLLVRSRPMSLGWVGLALVTFVALAGAVGAL